MSVITRIGLAAVVAMSIAAPAYARKVPDAAAVLSAVAHDYCARSESSNLYLDRKVARLNDVAESRSTLRTFFGDIDLVNSYFQQNTLDATLPTSANYECFRLSEYAQYAVSLPIFSKSGAEAYVYFADNCPALCGRGELLLLRRHAGHWHVSQRRVLWVS